MSGNTGRNPPDPWMWRELRRPVAGPDFSGAVMRRLGVGALAPRQAARRRARRTAARVAVCIVVAGGSALVFRAWSVLTRAMPAPGPTIPSAIVHDIEHHGRTIDGAIRTIQGLGTVQAARGQPDVPAPVGESSPQPEPATPRV